MARHQDEDAEPRLTAAGSAFGRRTSGVVLALVCAAQFMVVLDVSVVNVALPSVQRGLGFAAADLQWVAGAGLRVGAVRRTGVAVTFVDSGGLSRQVLPDGGV